MLFSGSSGAKKQKLILEISSSRVGGALIESDGSGRFENKKNFRSPNVILPEVDLPGLWRKIQAFVETAAKELKISSGIEEALVVFSSPWYFSEIRHVSRSSKEPVSVNRSFIEDIFEKDGDEFKKSVFGRFNISEKDAVILPVEIMRVSLNGYPVKSPQNNLAGKSAGIFEVILYSSAVFGPAAENVRRILEDRGIREIQTISSPFAFYKAALRMNEENLVVVDVGGEVTDVVSIKKGVIADAASFGRGFNHIVRHSASIFNLGFEETFSLISASAGNALEESKVEQVKKVLKDGVDEWQNLLMEVIRHLSFGGLLPEKIMLLGFASEFEEFKRAVANQEASKFVLMKRPFTILNSYLTYAFE